MIDEKKIKEFKKRRGDRFSSAQMRIKMYSDDCMFYRHKQGKEHIKKAMEIFKQNSSQESVGLDRETLFLKYFQGNSTENVDKIVENLRMGNNYFIESDLMDRKNKLYDIFIRDNIQKIEENNRKKYIDAVNLLLDLEKMSKLDELERNLSEINKDLISCIKYNNMIEKELEKGE